MITYKFWNVVVLQKGDEVLLLDRQHDDFKGFIPPGGKVEFPESFADSAIREVKEETGLTVHTLQFKLLYEYVNPTKKERYIIYHYWSDDFSGEVIADEREGKPHWVPISALDEIPMQPSVRRRFPYLLQPGMTEMQIVWDDEKNSEKEVRIRAM